MIECLLKLGMTQAQIAKCVGVTQGAISHIKSGTVRDVKASLYLELRRLLDAKQADVAAQ